MNIDARLKAVGNMVPAGCVLADIGTDHAYLPVRLLEERHIAAAIAGDIAEGPCRSARMTVAAHGMKDRIDVRKGSGLEVLRPGEAQCAVIAGMGASTITGILEASPEVAAALEVLVLQPMAGAASLRRWLCGHGWKLQSEDLVEDGEHFYEIMSAVHGESAAYTDAEYAVGPVLLRQGHELLDKHFTRQIEICRRLLEGMGRSAQASASGKYRETAALLHDLEVLRDERNRK